VNALLFVNWFNYTFDLYCSTRCVIVPLNQYDDDQYDWFNRLLVLVTVRAPVDGQWSSWSEWSACSVCGPGFHSRVRYCDSPAPQYGGLSCIGNDAEWEECSYGRCQGKKKSLFNDKSSQTAQTPPRPLHWSPVVSEHRVKRPVC